MIDDILLTSVPLVASLRTEVKLVTETSSWNKSEGLMGGGYVTECWDLENMTYIDRLVQERRNSSALAMELRLSYTNPINMYWSYVFLALTHRYKLNCHPLFDELFF